MAKKMEPTTFGWYLLGAMATAGIEEQSELAARGKLSKAWLSRAIYGRVSPTPEIVAKLAAGLGVPTQQVIDAFTVAAIEDATNKQG